MKKSHFEVGLVLSVILGIFGTWPCTWSSWYGGYLFRLCRSWNQQCAKDIL